MRAAFLIALLTASLLGCGRLGNLTAGDFQPGSADPHQFARDNYDCQTEAVVRENIAGSGNLPAVYNRAYAACMSKRGYRQSATSVAG